MITVLSVENARSWSWGLVMRSFAKTLSGEYKLVRMTGRVKSWGLVLCKSCGNAAPIKIPPVMISNDLVKAFDLVLIQNVDSLELIDDKRTVIGRIGGMRTFEEVEYEPANVHRFDEDLKKVAAVIATNQQLYNIAKSMNDNVSLIPNGIDLETFKPRQWNKTQRQIIINGNGDGKFVVGFAGNIHSKYAMHYKGWEFYVAATSRLRPQIETLNFLYRHNQISHNKMPEEFFHKIDCLVLPSVNEGCSNVAVEALACGVPVLVTKVGFHGERLEDGINCLFIERNINSIKSRIQLLMNNPELRQKLSFNGRLFAESNHDIRKFADEYCKIFQLVLARNKKAGRKE